MHDVAGIHETKADAPADRRGDMRVSELEFGVVDLRLIRRNRTIELADQRGLRVQLLLGDHPFLEEQFESFEIYFGIPALGLILGKLPQGLFQLDLKGTRVNLRENLSFVN